MDNYIVLFLAIAFEILVRIVPTKVNYSILDKIKNVAIKLHNLIDIVVPNKTKNENDI